MASSLAVNEISKAITELLKEFTSKDLFAKLKGKYGYGKLRAVMALKTKIEE